MNNKEIQLEDVIQIIKEKLNSGGTVTFTPHGTSMYPMLRNGEDVVVLKKPEGRLKYLDVALYRRSNGDFVLHITDENIIGVVTAFYRKGKHYTDNSLSYRFYKSAWEYIKAPMRMLYSAHRMNKSINIKKKR
ncbi:MAG: hypothetical protein KHW64_05580 [Eubacterium sp.]|nr:hypothetical protein [Eubacterium sp.]